ncbi:MAG: type II secretion system protein GspN [Desulfatitalea sp.]|nr:type II secretion system protein GspN [Desulfatitalea sp.]
MKRTSAIFFYTLYGGLAVGFFLYLLFPSIVVRDLLVDRIHQAHPQLRVHVNEVHPTFPPGLRLTPLSLVYAEMPIISMVHLKLLPGLISMLGSQKEMAYSGVIDGGGALTGNVRMLQDAPEPKLNGTLNLSGIPLEGIALLKQLPQVALTGLMTTFVDFDTHKGPGGTANLSIDMTPVRVTFKAPLLGLEQLDFSRIQSDLIVTPRMLQIKQIDATGAQIEARVTGSIVFRFPLKDSRLNLSCTLKPQAGFVAEQKNTMVGALLASSAAQQRGVIVRIAGTLEKPNYVVR